MAPFGNRGLIGVREKIAREVQVASVIAPGQSKLRLRIGRLAAAHHDRSHRMPLNKSGNRGSGRARRGLSGEKISGAGKSDPGGVHHGRRKDMRFFQAEHLLAQREQVGGESVQWSCRGAAAVIVRIGRHQRIVRGKVMIHTHGSEIFANRLRRAEEDFRDAASRGDGKIGGAGRSDRPQVQQPQVHDGRAGVGPCQRVGHKLHRCLVQVLTVTFIVGEHESLVFLNWPAERCAKLVPLEGRCGSDIEKIGSVQRIIAQILKCGAMPLIGSGLRDDRDLAPRALSVLRAVIVLQQVEFANRFHAQQSAGSRRPAAYCFPPRP